MRFFVKATAAPKPKTAETRQVAYFYAGILVIILLCQLFTFDDFLLLIESFWLPGGVPLAHLLGGVIVACELLALPFLLGMKLSSLMRVICMICGWLVSFIWIFLSLWLILTVNNISNIGILGTVVDILPGWWAVFIWLAIGILSAWSSWGMWPLKSRQKLKK